MAILVPGVLLKHMNTDVKIAGEHIFIKVSLYIQRQSLIHLRAVTFCLLLLQSLLMGLRSNST
ncbi:BnaA05g14970D [Brassica napus]|uniref:BnaA05g14970D protein n=1 Tax=Brassica napus TaxID=3708 RepID=A0A078IIV6_BRANA|nr:BnaA05g14970D [Brassica napus]